MNAMGMRIGLGKQMTFILAIALGALRAESSSASAPPVFGEFVGTTPCTEAIRPLLDIPMDAKSEVIRWKLTLTRDANTGLPAAYKLRCEHELASEPNKGTKVIQKA